METPPDNIDLGGEPSDDPFADVSNDPTDLPEGVTPGELGGENPSEEEPVPEDADLPGLPDEPESAPEPVPETPEEEQDVTPEEVETPVTTPETDPETPPATAEGEQGNEQEVSDQADEKPASKPKAKKKKKAKKKASTAMKNGERGYIILIRDTERGKWFEAFEGPKEDEPYILPARNGTIALRRAYRKLTEDEDNPGSYTLLPVPEAYYKPKTVAGRVHKQTAISID